MEGSGSVETLEEKYADKERDGQAVVENIRRACSVFMSRTPDYYATASNEARMFRTMEENDFLSPTSAASWAECFAMCRNELEQRPAIRKQPSAALASKLTRAEIDSWSARELQKQIESSPRRAAEIELVLSRKS